MSCTEFSCVFDDVTIATGATDTVVLVDTPANQCVRLKGFEIWFDGTSGTEEPIDVELMKASADGTGTSGTIVVTNQSGCTVQCSYKHTYTGEPTYSIAALRIMKLHPQGGIVNFPPHDSIILLQNAFYGLRIYAPAAIKCSGALFLEE